uniref:HTH_Tnp_Tc3_1 domain-containing protein n=2 Tax=Caenorhabditis japonica TaxID=281687 RepID=A0A8R1I0I8_CAEJA
MHQLGLKLHEMSRQLGRSRNAIRRYATDPINYGKKQKLPQTTQHPHLLTGKRRNSHQQLYKGLVCFEKNGQLVAQISINRESLCYKLLGNSANRVAYDGLNETDKWTIKKVTTRPLYYHLYVDVGQVPEEWRAKA